MPHHSLKHLYCSATEDYPDRGTCKSLVSFLLQHSSPQWCPKRRRSRFRQALSLGQSLPSRLPLPLKNDPTTQKADTLEGAGHHRPGTAAPEMESLFPQHCQKPHLAPELHLAAAQAGGERWAGAHPWDHEPGTAHSASAAATQPLWAHPSSGHVCAAEQSPWHRSAINDRGTTALSALFCHPDSKNFTGLQLHRQLMLWVGVKGHRVTHCREGHNLFCKLV